MSDSNHDYLRRLDPSFYQGLATIHWTHTIAHRKTGWLNSGFHYQFREILLHAAYTYHVWTIAYVLMPDHIHLLWFGSQAETDQKRATTWIRRQINYALKERPHSTFELQKQGYDHVLRPDETDRFSLEKVAQYIWDNPSRAELSTTENCGPFHGSIIPGSRLLSWKGNSPPESFWENYWDFRTRKVLEPNEREAQKRQNPE